jgi:hypothetical protein
VHLTGQVCVAESVSVVSCLAGRFWCAGPTLPLEDQWRYSYRVGRGEVFDPPGYRVPGPRPAAIGITELSGVAGAAEGRRSANGTGPPIGPLEDWSGPEVGLTSESRVQVALIRVAARPVLDVRAGQRGLLSGEHARQLSESDLRGLEGLAPLGMCRAEDDLAALCGLTWSNRLRPLGSGSPFQPGPGPEK